MVLSRERERRGSNQQVKYKSAQRHSLGRFCVCIDVNTQMDESFCLGQRATRDESRCGIQTDLEIVSGPASLPVKIKRTHCSAMTTFLKAYLAWVAFSLDFREHVHETNQMQLPYLISPLKHPEMGQVASSGQSHPGIFSDQMPIKVLLNLPTGCDTSRTRSPTSHH
jgi:hypothetical protein